MSKHKHHIIPVYHCKELGIDPDFDENYVMVDRLDHARIHWGYKCDDLEPLFEYITPAQWIIDLIPRGDNRDAGAAVITAKGELDGIDISGENNPRWIDGRWANDPEAYNKEYRQTPEHKANMKEYDKKRNQTPERKARQKVYYKAYEKKRVRPPEYKAWLKEYRLRKKTETQGEGTLKAFLK